MRTSVLGSILLLLHVAAGAQGASTPTPSDAAALPSLGYKTVAEALDALRAKPGVEVQITKPDAWTIINEPGGKQWSFTPSTHPAFPAVVRREVKVDAQGAVFIEMTALCESTKLSCDKLIEDFRSLNEQMRKSIQGRLKPSGTK